MDLVGPRLRLHAQVRRRIERRPGEFPTYRDDASLEPGEN
jgi:hypothetical protein